MVSGRADSAVRLLLIPYYTARPSSAFLFFPFSYHHITSPSIFYRRTPFQWDTVSLTFSGGAGEKNLFLRQQHKEKPVF